jgi:AcrR family transcriptional regulator
VTQTADLAPRTPLSRDRVLRTAVELADEAGIEAVSMRRLGQELGVEAMALYRHVRNKDELVDGMIERIVGDIEAPPPGGDWQAAMRRLSLAARAVMLGHPWAPSVIVDRKTVGPALLRHVEAVMAILRGGGFSLELAHHALHVLGSRILGFTQDPFDDASDPRPDPETAAQLARSLAVAYPYLGELALAATHEGSLGGCDDDVEFAFGLDLILEGLDRRRAAAG